MMNNTTGHVSPPLKRWPRLREFLLALSLTQKLYVVGGPFWCVDWCEKNFEKVLKHGLY